MASPAKTSSSSPCSSSPSIPCKTNPNMKKSELCDPMRRSFSGNPFTKPSVIVNPRAFNPKTPANSPSDFPRRHSTGRESVASLRDPNKENVRGQNPKPTTRVKSPALSKGTRNFMSPTISAASKINASPRKQILVERNEPVRSSVSFSDVKSLIMEDNESTPEVALKQKKVSFSDVKSAIMEDESTLEIGLNQKKVSFSDVKSIIMEDTESTPEISLNQKKVSFADVKSIVTEDNESAPEIATHDLQRSYHEHEETLKSIIMEDTESTPDISLNRNKVSFSDVKSIVTEDNESAPENLTHDSQSSYHELEEPLKSNADFDYKESKNDSDSAPETVTEDKDSVNVDASFKISPRASISPSCPVLAPLDSDPLMLPYDPKTNYLSPRPQFLHYRPNPRIELYREREGKQLDDQFASESYSDTDVTEEKSPEGSPRDSESEDISSEETRKEGEEEEFHVSKPNHIAPDMAEESFKAKRMSKPRFSTRSKFITLLLFLAFAFFSVLLVADSPAFNLGLEELSLPNFQVPPKVEEYAKANFDHFTQNLQHWSARFLSYVSNIISSSREVHNLGPFQYANLSHLIEDHMIEGHQTFDPSVMKPVRERDAGTELFDGKHYQEIEADEAVDEYDEQEFEEQEDQENEASENLELVSEQPDEVQQGIEAEKIELDHLEVEEGKGVEFAAQIDAEHKRNVDIRDQQSKISPEAAEIQHDISETGVPEGDGLNNIAETLFPKEVKSDDLKIEDSADNSQSSEVVDSTINGQEDRFLTDNVMAFSLLVLCILAASAFIYIKSGKPSNPDASVPVEQPVLCKKSECSPMSVGSKDTIFERVSPKNWQTEVEIANESCPSEMISYYERTSLSYSNKGLKESNEYQSQERKTKKTYRRESLASSDYSTGSASYGSFTTYEKITSKHGVGDEEIVTPVRRSSRIRNQVTSP